jgi:hypothetical protein
VRQETHKGAGGAVDTGGVSLSGQDWWLATRLLGSRIATLFPSEQKLHPGRFAYPHELSNLLSGKLDGEQLLLAQYLGNHVLRVAKSPRAGIWAICSSAVRPAAGKASTSPVNC